MWVLRDENKGRTEASEMRFLWPVLDISLRDKMGSTDIRKQEQDEWWKRSGISKEWHDHVERMPPEHLPWQAYFCDPNGRRDIGRPRRKWAQFLWFRNGS
jgi:hypothetical protein